MREIAALGEGEDEVIQGSVFRLAYALPQRREVPALRRDPARAADFR